MGINLKMIIVKAIYNFKCATAIPTCYKKFCIFNSLYKKQIACEECQKIKHLFCNSFLEHLLPFQIKN